MCDSTGKTTESYKAQNLLLHLIDQTEMVEQTVIAKEDMEFLTDSFTSLLVVTGCLIKITALLTLSKLVNAEFRILLMAQL